MSYSLTGPANGKILFTAYQEDLEIIICHVRPESSNSDTSSSCFQANIVAPDDCLILLEGPPVALRGSHAKALELLLTRTSEMAQDTLEDSFGSED